MVLGIMVAGSCTCLGTLVFFELILIHPGEHVQLVCVYLHKHNLLVFITNKHGLLAHASFCLRMKRAID